MGIFKSWVLGVEEEKTLFGSDMSQIKAIVTMVGGGEKLGRLNGEREREREVATLRYNPTVVSFCFVLFFLLLLPFFFFFFFFLHSQMWG